MANCSRYLRYSRYGIIFVIISGIEESSFISNPRLPSKYAYMYLLLLLSLKAKYPMMMAYGYPKQSYHPYVCALLRPFLLLLAVVYLSKKNKYILSGPSFSDCICALKPILGSVGLLVGKEKLPAQVFSRWKIHYFLMSLFQMTCWYLLPFQQIQIYGCALHLILMTGTCAYCVGRCTYCYENTMNNFPTF